MKLSTCLVAFFLALCIVWIIPFKVPTEVDYWLGLAVALQINEPPSLLGEYEWEDGFVEGSIATLYLISYPIRWAFWCMQQLTTITAWLTHSVEVRRI